MKIIEHVDFHEDSRRALKAWRPEGFSGAEVTCIIVTEDGARLGNHSHPYGEYFMLVAGKCVLYTWSPKDLGARKGLVAPLMFIIEKGEEHLFVCEAGTVLNTFSPKTFSKENLIPAKHLDSI